MTDRHEINETRWAVEVTKYGNVELWANSNMLGQPAFYKTKRAAENRAKRLPPLKSYQDIRVVEVQFTVTWPKEGGERSKWSTTGAVLWLVKMYGVDSSAYVKDGKLLGVPGSKTIGGIELCGMEFEAFVERVKHNGGTVSRNVNGKREYA